MKKTISIFLILVAASFGLLASCKPAVTTATEETTAVTEETKPAEETTAAEEKGKVIGYSANFAFFNDATTDWVNGITDTASKRGVSVIVLDAKGDVTKQLADVEDLITRGVDGLVIWPNDSKAIVPAVEAANKAGIPVAVLDRGSEGGEYITLVAGDDVAASKNAAEFIADSIKGPGYVLELTGAPGSQVVANRSKGFAEGITKNPNLQLITQPTDWTIESGLKVTENVLQAHADDLLAIWAHSDEMAIGGLEAVKGANKVGKIMVVGYGAFTPMVELIKKGEVAAAVGFPSWTMGVALANALLDYMEGKEVANPILIDEPMVTKDNVDAWKRGRE
ncbi:MAG: sugar ABC transporter substrate-binding protein [Actinobacteria bacterium]|nr:sugar ABC transporter substrate-binding protein [Actinomycetota bacterium]